MGAGFLPGLIFSLMAAVATLGGILAMRLHEVRVRRQLPLFAAYAATVLITAALTHILPKAMASGGYSLPVVGALAVGGYLAMALLGRLLSGHVCDRPASARMAAGLAPLLGIGLHSLLDGMMMATGFAASPYLGAMMAAGMVLHEFPEGLVTMALMIQAGHSAHAAGLRATLAAAITTPLGFLLAWPLVGPGSAQSASAPLALTGGALIWVAVKHLAPTAMRASARTLVLPVSAGLLTVMALSLPGA